jgi:modification methylase
MDKKKGTETSSFGVSGRIGHDSSKFYNTRLYQGKTPEKVENYIERDVPSEVLNKIFCKSSEHMDEIPDDSIHLMVTSPPYNVSKEYDEDLTLDEYRKLLKKVFNETYKKLVVGGRACINIANVGRKPYIPLHSYIIKDMLDIGFFMRGEILWNKSSSSGVSTAWGSWQSPKNPTLRDIHEYIMVFSKGCFHRLNPENKKSTISKDEFLEFTKSIWNFQAESAKRVNHPAPFPIELPYRCIQLFTFKGDVILDPFVGSGSTCISALRTERYFIGYDNNQKYVDIALRRIKREKEQLKLFSFREF